MVTSAAAAGVGADREEAWEDRDLTLEEEEAAAVAFAQKLLDAGALEDSAVEVVADQVAHWISQVVMEVKEVLAAAAVAGVLKTEGAMAF